MPEPQSYSNWLSYQDPSMGNLVTEDIYSSAIQQYGKMPHHYMDPSGNAFWTNNEFAQQYGLPTGTYLSTAGTKYYQPGSETQQGSGAVFAPWDITQQAGREGYNGAAQRTVIPELYSNAGYLDAMQYGGSGYPQQVQDAPLRSRTQASIDTPVNTPVSGMDTFLNWWRGQGARMEGPLGEQHNMPAGINYDTPYGQQMLMPGMVGMSFDPRLAQSNPGLFEAMLQAQQIQTGANVSGPVSPWLPPWLTQAYGINGTAQLPEGQMESQNAFAQQYELPPWAQGGGYYTPTGQQANPYWGGGGGYTPPGTTPPGGGGGVGTTPPPSGGSGGGGGGTGGGGTGGGGGTNTPGTGTPPPTGTPPTPPGGGAIPPGTPGQVPQAPGGGPTNIDQWMANLANEMQWLQGFAENGGYATDATPAWQAMVDAQEYNLDRRAADLAERFNVSGGRFSSDFGTAMQDFQRQAGLEQNSLLANMTFQSQEAARARELQAAQGLGQYAFQGPSQLSGQNFQASMQDLLYGYGAARDLFNASAGAAGQLAGLGGQAAMGLLGGSNQAGLAEAQRQLQLQQFMNQMAPQLSQLWQQNLNTGAGLGASQYGIQQDQIDRLYQEWMRTQPQYNPLLQYMYAGATAYPGFSVNPQPFWQQALLAGIGAAGNIAGGFAAGS